MFTTKKLLTFVGLMVLAASLVACNVLDPSGTNTSGGGNTGGGDKVTLKVWAPTEDKAVIEHIMSEYQKTSEGANIEFDLKHVKEGDVSKELVKDVDLAADVFATVDDNLTDMVKTNNLLEILGSRKDAAIANNISWTVDAATRNGKLYGFPQTSDNTYILWYNTDYVSSGDTAKLETLLQAAQSAGKKVAYNISDSWIGTSIFLANGGQLSISMNGDISVQNCNFNTAGPVAAANAAFALTDAAKSVWSDVDLVAGMTAETPTVVAGVGGTWQYQELSKVLGSKLAATKLPTINVGGVDHQLGSFRSSKMVSVKANTLHPNEAVAFADYAANYEAQKYRFEQRGIGPSNKTASQLSAVTSSQVMQAVTAQNAFGVLQGTSVGRSYWDPIAAVGLMILKHSWLPYSTAQQALDNAVDQMNN